MKSFITYFLMAATFALAHDGGHGTPEDPIASLPKLKTTQGTSFGLEGMIKGNKFTMGLRNAANEVVNPSKSGLKEMGSAEIKFKGDSKPSKFNIKLSGNFYEGTFIGKGNAPTVKVVLNEKNGKKQTVFIEDVEMMH